MPDIGPIPVLAPPPKRSGGWKSKLGSILKGLGGVALGYFLENVLPGLLGGGHGLGGALGLTIAGSALKDYGMAHKMDKQTEAIEENTKETKL